MLIEYVNPLDHNDRRPIGEIGSIAGHPIVLPLNDLSHNKNKENNMTDFEIKETVVQTGYVDKDGKFVPETDPSKIQPMDTTRFVQTDEDIVAD